MRTLARLCALLALVCSPAFAQTLDPARTPPLTAKSLRLGGPITCAAGTTCDASDISLTPQGLPSRTLRSLMSEVVNVGQICDGTTDVVAAIRAAAALAGPARPLYFPPQPGACLLSGNFTVPSGTTIRADPGTVTLKPTPGNTADPVLLALGGVSNVTVIGLGVDGGGSSFANSANVVTVYNGSRVTFDRVAMANTRGLGLIFSQSNNSGIRNSSFTNIGNRWKTTLSAADRRAAVAFCCGTTAQNVGNFATDNTFVDIGLDAVSATETSGFVAARNNCAQTVRQWSLAPSFADYPACIYASNSVDVSINQNVSTDAHGNGIDIAGTTGFNITANYIVRSGSGGIAVDANYGNISGNTANNNAQSGNTGFCLSGICAFGASGPLNGISIPGNSATDTQGTKTQRYGIEVKGSACLNCAIAPTNVVVGNGVAPYGGLISAPTTLAVAAGGTGLTGGAWTAYTPTLTSSGGAGVSLVLVSAAYQQIGKALSIRAAFRVDYTGSGPTTVTVALPSGMTSAVGQAGSASNVSSNTPLSAQTSAATGLTVAGAGGVVVSSSGQYVSVSFTGEMQ